MSDYDLDENEWEPQLDDGTPATPPHVDGADEPPELVYATLEAFVTEQLAPLYRRNLNGQDRTWCPEWWRHAEAISRLEALWRALEHLPLDAALGMSVWLRDHLDHHMEVLLDADGPFKGCKPDKHAERIAPLPLTPPPPVCYERRRRGQTAPRLSSDDSDPPAAARKSPVNRTGPSGPLTGTPRPGNGISQVRCADKASTEAIWRDRRSRGPRT